jgi:chromosome segregation protein
MYLKKLEISGFKSFANKTVLNFPQGVTAIVGPNGSGKSNIADAVKWVLGEQSMKSLRGKRSEDVIFTGSSQKSKMSVAAVSLYLDNRNKKIPLDYEEVVLTRKLFRNGDSEYLINKSRARLIDIVSLISRSGISQKGYCIIDQGMADSILAATPVERMVIFEEATGVRKFQMKKQQTISKLEATKRNLLRVEDLLNEIEPRLNSLKRQANKAQRRGEIEENLRIEQEKLFLHIWIDLNRNSRKQRADKEELEEIIKRLQKEVLEAKHKLSKSESGNNEYQNDFDNWQREISLLQESINDLQKDLSIIEGRIQIEEEKKERMKNPEYVPINLGYVKEKISRIASLYGTFFDLVRKLTSLRDIDLARKKGVEVRENIECLLREIEQGKVSQNDKKVVFDDSVLKKLKARKVEVLAEIQKQNGRYKEVKDKIYRLNNEEQEKRKTFFQLEKELQTKQDELNKFKDNLNRINIELAKFEVRKEDVISEINNELGSVDIINKIKKGDLASELERDSFDQDESRIKIRKLKLQLDQIGGIDPLIMEEYEETKKRFEFLSAQSSDLAQASESLQKVIKDLEEKIEKIFKTSFENINKEFDKYFKIIFGSGKASLSIKYSISEKKTEKESENGRSNNGNNEDIEDDSEKQRIAGIEIDVALAGKKINSLSMLSGGERALVSVAILFAIISNNPPPFSVLDEIDAALDESNSGKIARILKEVSSKTQFIVITHNREMIQGAGVIYGVTMQDDGVSKIVSLKLDEMGK